MDHDNNSCTQVMIMCVVLQAERPQCRATMGAARATASGSTWPRAGDSSPLLTAHRTSSCIR